MNRLESIKERAESLTDVSIRVETDANKVYIGPKLVATWHDADSLERLEQLLTEDTMHLLQRLERYEKAMGEINELCLSCGGIYTTPEKDVIKIIQNLAQE